MLTDTEWVVLHGDSDRSPIWAVFGDDGGTFDLTNWFIRAQARDTTEDSTPEYQWLVGAGIDVGTAVVETKQDRHVPTSTVQLYLTPAASEAFPRTYSGVVDVEIASDNTSAPAERHTIVSFPFRVTPDVTRAGV